LHPRRIASRLDVLRRSASVTVEYSCPVDIPAEFALSWSLAI
jgi:hypothetical protein